VPASPSASSQSEEDAAAERNTVLLLVLGCLAAISAVIAALVIFTGDGGPAEKPEPAADVAAGEQSVIVGRDDASTKVVVYEDYASPDSREFEIASRDFLRIEAARGEVQVEYRPVSTAGAGYSADAITAWAAVLGAGTPTQVLAFHDVLFDRQPPGASSSNQFLAWAQEVGIDDPEVLDAMSSPDEEFVAEANRRGREAGVRRTPLVVVDDAPMTAGSPTELADRLQRRLLREGS
jgi:protein-disulfide isomerase